MTLRAGEPAELLAQAHLSLGEVPRDCAVLLGRSGGHCTATARLGLDDILAVEQPGDLAGEFAALGAAGCTSTFALVLAGDGYSPVAEPEWDAAMQSGIRLLTAAALHPQDLPDILDLWVLSEGSAVRMLLRDAGDEEFDLGVAEPVDLPPVRETLLALQAQAAGIPFPREDAGRLAALAAAGSETPAARLHRPVAPLPVLWSAVPRMLDTLALEAGAEADPADRMTECERLRAIASRLAERWASSALLVLLVHGPQAGEAEEESILVDMVQDRSFAPESRICAGGSEYVALQELRCALEGMAIADPEGSEDEATAAADAVTAVLGVLAWWNHRFGTAGDLALSILHRSPDHTLALLLAQLATTPVPPAWRPGPSVRRSSPRPRHRARRRR